MRVKSITPICVTETELDRRRQRYRRLSPDSLEVDLFNLPDDKATPRSLDSAEDIAASERLVVGMALADTSGYEAILPDCVLDPGLDELERSSEVRAFGMLKLTASFLCGCGLRYAAVVRNQAIADELGKRIAHYGLDDLLDDVVVLDLDFEAVSNAELWRSALLEVQTALKRSGTRALINGCSAVDISSSASHLPTVDPTELALYLLGTTQTFELLGARTAQPIAS
jgi:allantoin racemase